MNKVLLVSSVTLALSACGTNSTNRVSEGVLIASLAQASGGTIDNTVQTTVWLSQKENGTCVVLSDDATATVNGSPARLVSSGEAPDWIARKYNRYAGYSWPMFQIEAVQPAEGARVKVEIRQGGEKATATFSFSSGAWAPSECLGVTSCCTGSTSGATLACVDSR